jgi:hypothetical protein
MCRAETVEKGHGRIETRRIAVRPIPSRLDREWPGARQIVRLERLRELKDRCSRQVVYAIPRSPPEAMDAQALLGLARAHWQIENRLFRVRSGNAPAALAHLRDATLTLIRKRKLKPKPARETFAANPKAAIRTVIRA